MLFASNRSGLRIFVTLALLLGASGILGGCVPQEITDRSLRSVRHGVLANENLRIVAKDGSFELEGGESFTVPFDINLWEDASAFEGARLANNFQEAVDRGAKRVFVHVDGLDEPLHGVLAFNKVIGAAYGPSSRAYRVVIPDDRLVSAAQGNVTVTYEAVDFTESWSDGRENDYWWYAWVLWLADTPL